MTTKKSMVGLGAGILAIGAVLLGNTAIQAATADTVINGQISSVITISSVSPRNIVVNPGNGAATTSVDDTITVNTNNATGYTVTLAMLSTATNNKLKHETTADVIDAGAGTMALPAALGANTWGYRVDGVGDFGSGTTTENNVANSNFTWAGVPQSTGDKIVDADGPATNATTKVWFAIHANNSLRSGKYTNTVTYTATAK